MTLETARSRMNAGFLTRSLPLDTELILFVSTWYSRK